MITTYNEISYFGFNFHRKSTFSCIVIYCSEISYTILATDNFLVPSSKNDLQLYATRSEEFSERVAHDLKSYEFKTHFQIQHKSQCYRKFGVKSIIPKNSGAIFTHISYIIINSFINLVFY